MAESAPTWQPETSRYLSSLTGWSTPIVKGAAALGDLGIVRPLAVPPSEPEVLGVQLLGFVDVNLRSAAELVDGARAEWQAGRFVMACLSVRLLLELSAATRSAVRTAERLARSDDGSLEDIATRVDRLVAGARFPVALPTGGVTTTPAINVQTFIDGLETDRPGTADDYAFLSAGSHPCHLQQFYLHMAGVKGGNWSNEVFAAHAHEVLGRVVRIGGDATAALGDDAAQMARLLSSLLERHRR